MPLAVVLFEFDPYLRFGDRAISLETLGVAVAVLVVLGLAAVAAGRTPVLLTPGETRLVETRSATARPGPSAGHGAPTVIRPDWPQLGHLRRDDLLLVALGSVPGAIAGGRLGHVLVHLDYYAANPAAILDPTRGALQLGLAIVGGACTGAYVARLLDRRTRAWLHAAAIPVLIGLALGKAALALGGSGQGVAWAGQPSWGGNLATAYLGVGPWGSLEPGVAAWPSQLIEAALALGAVAVVGLLLVTGRFGARDGRAFAAALGLWAVGRFVVAFTWRDATVLGPLRADQLISISILAGCLVAGWWIARATRRVREDAASEVDLQVDLLRADPLDPSAGRSR